MKKLSILPLLAVLALFATLSSFKAGAPQTKDEETRNVAPFRKIGLAYPANVILRQGNAQNLRIEGSKEQMNQLDVKVESGRLTIERKDEYREYNWSTSDKDRLTIYITVPTVEGLSVTGSGKIKGEGTFQASSLDLAVSGSGAIQLDATVEEVTSRISGSGSILLSGEGKQSVISVSGSGSMKGYEFKASAANVSISGSGSCEVNATSSLKSSISGSGRVTYHGSPNVDSRVSGSGSVKKRG